MRCLEKGIKGGKDQGIKGAMDQRKNGIILSIQSLRLLSVQYDRDANGRTILYKIDDIEKVNYRRMRIGMGATTVPE